MSRLILNGLAVLLAWINAMIASYYLLNHDYQQAAAWFGCACFLMLAYTPKGEKE